MSSTLMSSSIDEILKSFFLIFVTGTNKLFVALSVPLKLIVYCSVVFFITTCSKLGNLIFFDSKLFYSAFKSRFSFTCLAYSFFFTFYLQLLILTATMIAELPPSIIQTKKIVDWPIKAKVHLFLSSN